jgi:ribulose-phosphate 3-epimerase
VLDKVRMAHRLRVERGLSFGIEIDGGVSPETIGRCREAGVDVFVAGSAVFGAGGQSASQYAAAIASLRTAADQPSAGPG